MDFIPLNVPDGSWILPLQFTAAGLMLFGIPLVSKKVTDSKWAIVCFVGLGLGLLLAMTSFMATSFQKDGERVARSDWESAVIAEVQGMYGIELSHDEFVALDFPATEPDEDFVAYGTIADTVVKGGQVKQRALTLIWSDGELSLASLKGELVLVTPR